MKYICTKCNKTEDVYTRKPHCTCGGLWDLDVEIPKYNKKSVLKSKYSQERFIEYIPVDPKVYSDITMGEGATDIVKIDNGTMVKMDYMMPTLSYKDRGAAVLIAHAKSIGVDTIAQDSSGNAGCSIAAYGKRAGIKCHIYVPEGTSPKKIQMIKNYDATVNIVKGTRDDCANKCRADVEKTGMYYGNHVYNPFFYQGTKLYIYEVYESLGRIPENIFVPVGNGTLYLGIIKGLEELINSGVIDSMPNIIGLQSEKSSPIYNSWKNKSQIVDKVIPQYTLAEGIAIGEPKRGDEILRLGYKYNVKFAKIKEENILSGKRELSQAGIYVEDTTAGIYSGAIDYIKSHNLTDCLIPMTGAGLKSD